MQGGSSKGSLPKQTSGSAPSKGKLNTSSKIDGSASRTKNTSGGDSAGTAGGKMSIYCDGKNVTPKSLVPSHYQKMMGADGQGQENAASAIAENMPAAAGKEDGDRPPEERETVQVPERSAIGKGMKSAALSVEELDRRIDIVLGETETETLLFFFLRCVWR